MKKLLLLLFTIGIIAFNSHTVQGQSIKLVGQNALNGAVNGVLLGGATMALQDSEYFGPVRTGLGAGTLYGIGVGVHDVSQIEKGQQFYISATFNDATNTSVIPLLDTLYGAAGGALIASSVSLIIREPLVESLQYGSAIGAWAGFGFGLFDAFVLAEGPDFSQASLSQPSDVKGFITYGNKNRSVEVGLVNPNFFEKKELTSTSLTAYYHPVLTLMDINIEL